MNYITQIFLVIIYILFVLFLGYFLSNLSYFNNILTYIGFKEIYQPVNIVFKILTLPIYAGLVSFFSLKFIFEYFNYKKINKTLYLKYTFFIFLSFFSLLIMCELFVELYYLAKNLQIYLQNQGV